MSWHGEHFAAGVNLHSSEPFGELSYLHTIFSIHCRFASGMKSMNDMNERNWCRLVFLNIKLLQSMSGDKCFSES